MPTRRTEKERVDAGVDDYDAAGVPLPVDPTETEQYQEAQAEVRRQTEEGELHPLTDSDPFPPTHYDRS